MASVTIGNLENQTIIKNGVDEVLEKLNNQQIIAKAVKSVQQGRSSKANDGRVTVMHSEVDLNKSILFISSEDLRVTIEERYSTKFETEGAYASFYWQLIEFY